MTVKKNSHIILASLLILFGCNDKYIDLIPYDSDRFQEACDVTTEINRFELLNYQGTKMELSIDQNQLI